MEATPEQYSNILQTGGTLSNRLLNGKVGDQATDWISILASAFPMYFS